METEQGIDAAAAYSLHPNVAVRPEPFGALVYHYGNRKLVFLKSPRMVTVVRGLDAAASVDEALQKAGVPEKSRTNYLEALGSLLRSDMIVLRCTAAATDAAATAAPDYSHPEVLADASAR